MVQSFGKIVVAVGGTPTRATANLSNPMGRAVTVQSFMVQALPGNTGLIYVLRDDKAANGGAVGDHRGDGIKVIGIIGAPASSSSPVPSPPSASYSIPNAVTADDLRHIWIDAQTNGEGAIVVGTHVGPSYD